MKTAISLPDALFRSADRHARRQKLSRSKLYAQAVAEYLQRHAPEEVTQAVNKVWDSLQGDQTDIAFTRAASRRLLENETW